MAIIGNPISAYRGTLIAIITMSSILVACEFLWVDGRTYDDLEQVAKIAYPTDSAEFHRVMVEGMKQLTRNSQREAILRAATHLIAPAIAAYALWKLREKPDPNQATSA